MKFSPIIAVLIISVMVVVIIAVVVVSRNNNEGFGTDYNDFCTTTECRQALDKIGCGPEVKDDVHPNGWTKNCGSLRTGSKNFRDSIIKSNENM